MKKAILIFSLLGYGYLNAQTTELTTLIENTTGKSASEIDSMFTTGTLVVNKGGKLLIMDSFSLAKGDMIQVYLPTQERDFIFINRKKRVINTKLISGVAQAAGTGAFVVGVTSGNLNTLSNAVNVMNKARFIRYSADALDKINELPISKEAKKIAGKEMEVISWEYDNEMHVVITKLGKAYYEIELEGAFITKEIIFTPNNNQS